MKNIITASLLVTSLSVSAQIIDMQTYTAKFENYNTRAAMLTLKRMHDEREDARQRKLFEEYAATGSKTPTIIISQFGATNKLNGLEYHEFEVVNNTITKK